MTEGQEYPDGSMIIGSPAKAIRQLDEAKLFPTRIVTKVVPLEGFYTAEAYHQHFLDEHPDNPYIVYNDLPKLDHLKKAFPELLKKKK